MKNKTIKMGSPVGNPGSCQDFLYRHYSSDSMDGKKILNIEEGSVFTYKDVFDFVCENIEVFSKNKIRNFWKHGVIPFEYFESKGLAYPKAEEARSFMFEMPKSIKDELIRVAHWKGVALNKKRNCYRKRDRYFKGSLINPTQ